MVPNRDRLLWCALAALAFTALLPGPSTAAGGRGACRRTPISPDFPSAVTEEFTVHRSSDGRRVLHDIYFGAKRKLP